MISSAVITVSDSCFRGEREDVSGPAVALALAEAGFSVILRRTVPDEVAAIQAELLGCLAQARLVVTTGGTGIGPRDVTPDATRPLCDRSLDGVAELMRSEGRQETIFSVLSRAFCGTAGLSIILNLPGSPRGAVTSLRAVLPLLPHALRLLQGDTQHDDTARDQEVH
ncbi:MULTISPECIES: MogA/MoaB family molybdenum cofactor biosynthesis protein [Acidobacterium]|uniref:Molybdopterin adenylyltransferase n=1 Tax=Acidobacterium capsulatum (strain ATCC 51196 / DSM 11244 / BCRC 80197 / JCM 7670 / NBRC 15755 / NCIMB 13165 / 161) TaxID=240015 RepID=C1F8A1_ACIC5|nr:MULTISPECIES: MogA/MoaB family molybdenum cofactor biosynthesis protein [Acidobacterium]ACO33638.1 molybdenum cofactor biosynthesis protein B [Acidobacterium capsulatum ATCC 51196]HCT59784.1 MogA/MoaB family molybdenum cofactor biosynthesis protein [Acidobacterium sp.]